MTPKRRDPHNLTQAASADHGEPAVAASASEAAGQTTSPPTATNDAEQPASVATQSTPSAPSADSRPEPTAPPVRHGKSRRWLWSVLGAAALVIGGLYLVPLAMRAYTTISTDDAYVNGYVTTVAPRVSGQVSRVMVDDNNRVKRGDVLVQLDKEPYEIQLALSKAVLEGAQADLAATQHRLRGIASQARSSRFRLEHAMEDVRNQIALLKAHVAQLKAEQANLALAQSDFTRTKPLVEKGAISKQQFDQYVAALDVAKNRVKSAEQVVQQTRASLGLAPNTENPLDVPADLDQTFSAVRQALADLLQSAAPLGVIPSTYDGSPKQVIEEFYKRDPERNLDRIYARLLEDAAPIKQARAELNRAKANLAEAELNLRYCDVLAEIDGVVTRRNVNPGNNLQAGQAVMAIRSLTDIWIDANFKETQLANLRIGQSVDVEVDMYGARREFRGRITGFTMGTGSTLALLPPQNATGNFVKVVQRLPVRIDLQDYDPENETLFVGLSVVPYVRFREPPEGPNAGKRLQELALRASAP